MNFTMDSVLEDIDNESCDESLSSDDDCKPSSIYMETSPKFKKENEFRLSRQTLKNQISCDR